MIVIEQMAMRTPDMSGQLEQMRQLGQLSWVRDTVEAAHLYVHPDYVGRLGLTFTVELAFNYDLMPGIEFELIQLLNGNTYQLLCEGRYSHMGYHTRDDQSSDQAKTDSLLTELKMLQQMNLTVMQVSQTIEHANTSRRYRYAFVSGHLTNNVPLKIIQRLAVGTDQARVEAGVELFSALNHGLIV